MNIIKYEKTDQIDFLIKFIFNLEIIKILF